MTGADLHALRSKLGLSIGQMASVAGVSYHALYQWEKHNSTSCRISPLHQQLINALARQVAGEQSSDEGEVEEQLLLKMSSPKSLFRVYLVVKPRPTVYLVVKSRPTENRGKTEAP